MKRAVLVLLVRMATLASTAEAPTTITIDGHITETVTKGGPSPWCFKGDLGIGELRGPLQSLRAILVRVV